MYIVHAGTSNYKPIILSNGLMGDDDILYGSTISYSNGTYTLNNTIAIKYSEWVDKYNTINNNHYTCFSTSNTCSSVYYVTYTESYSLYYVTLTNGKLLSDLISETLDYNTNESTIKTYIDTWYKNNLEASYADYLEDTVFCNDRSINDYGPFSETGSTTDYMYFSSYNRLNSKNSPTLTCSRDIDKFTVNTSNGNGALTYPVGLITADEITYAGGRAYRTNSNYYLYTGQYFWSLSPYYFYYYYYSGVWEVDSGGYLSRSYVVGAYGVRPVVSLKLGTGYQEGDGTAENPYVIK